VRGEGGSKDQTQIGILLPIPSLRSKLLHQTPTWSGSDLFVSQGKYSMIGVKGDGIREKESTAVLVGRCCPYICT
jgi:hypothetical protein